MGYIADSHSVLLGYRRGGQRDRLKALIADAGYRVRAVSSVRTLVVDLQGGGYFTVFVDGELPDLDISAIRAAGSAGGMEPYVVLVARVMDDTAVRADEDGPDDYLIERQDPTEIALRLKVAERASSRRLRDRVSEERFRAAAQGSSDAVYVLEPIVDSGGSVVDLRFVDANGRAEEVFGVAPRGLVGRTLTQALPGSAGADEAVWIGSVIELGKTDVRDVARMLPGPTRRHLHVTATPVAGGAVVTASDITEVRLARAEEAARRRVATAVATGREPSHVFAQAAQEAASLLDAGAAAVLRRDGASLLTVGSWAADEARSRELGSRVLLSSDAAAARAVLTLEPARNDAMMQATGNDVSGRRSFLRNAVAAPIWVGEDVWGALSVAASGLDQFPPGSEHRLAHFADLVTLAIANAEDRAALVAEARTDPLTRIANRRVFHERLSAELARAERSRVPLSLVLIDLDHFKLVNDRWGHAVGDSVIVEMAWLLSDHAREADTVARVGGDELGWILPDAAAPAALRAAERLRQAAADQRFTGAGALTISLGVAERGSGMDGAELFRRADAALYAAKLDGRDRAITYSEQIDSPLEAGGPPRSSG